MAAQVQGPEKRYRVVYEMDIEASSHLQAARRVHEIMLDPESIPPVLWVYQILSEEGEELEIVDIPDEIDLYEEYERDPHPEG